MCTVPSVKLPSGAAGDGSDIGWGFGAVWPSFVIWPPRLPLPCAKAVLAASAPTRAPMKAVRVQLESGIARQRQAHAPGVRIEVVASALAERADEFDAAAD